MANYLSRQKQVQVAQCLVDGVSIRATERIVGVHRDTVIRLLLKLGHWCQEIHDSLVRNVPAQRIEVDECWTFVQKKQARVTLQDDPARVGDFWIWVAIDPETKLVVAYRVGKRDLATATRFMHDLAERLPGRFQLTTDAWQNYPEVVDLAFHQDIDYATTQKLVGITTQRPQEVSAPHQTGRLHPQERHPRTTHATPHLHIHRRTTEPHTPTVLTKTHPSHQRLLQETRKPHRSSPAPLHTLQLRPHTRITPRHTRHASRHLTPTLET